MKSKQVSKKEVSKTLGIIIGHSGLQTHLEKIVAADNSVCRECGEDDVTLDNFPANAQLSFASNRTQFLENDSIPGFNHLMGIQWKKIREYVGNNI